MRAARFLLALGIASALFTPALWSPRPSVAMDCCPNDGVSCCPLPRAGGCAWEGCDGASVIAAPAAFSPFLLPTAPAIATRDVEGALSPRLFLHPDEIVLERPTPPPRG